MRYFFALILALLAGAAQAQAPACIPSIYGEQFPGSKVHGPVRGDAGWYGWGWCVAPSDGHPYPVYRLCAHGECAANIGLAVGDVLMQLGTSAIGADPKTLYGGWWATNPPVFVCDGTPAAGTPRGNACTELAKLLAADRPAWTAPVPPPPPPASAPPPAPVYTYHVKPNGVALDRPVYGLSGTTLTLRSGRALVGQPCDITHPTKASGTSGDLYAEFAPVFSPGVVALCAK